MKEKLSLGDYAGNEAITIQFGGKPDVLTVTQYVNKFCEFARQKTGKNYEVILDEPNPRGFYDIPEFLILEDSNIKNRRKGYREEAVIPNKLSYTEKI